MDKNIGEKMAQQKFKVKLTADEMQVIKASVEATSYAGQFSEMITKIKKKMIPPQEKAPVHDIKEGGM